MRTGICAAAAAGMALLLAGGAEAGPKFKKEGMASWYKMGTRTANGERYDPMGITAAHPSLPFDTKVRVTHANSGKSVIVRINDRGPFTGGRIIDLSQGAAKVISLTRSGVAKVKIEVLGDAAVADAAPAPSPRPVQLASAEARPATASPPLRQMAERQMGHSTR